MTEKNKTKNKKAIKAAEQDLEQAKILSENPETKRQGRKEAKAAKRRHSKAQRRLGKLECDE